MMELQNLMLAKINVVSPNIIDRADLENVRMEELTDTPIKDIVYQSGAQSGEIATGNQFFVPHHPVLGRKLRVVFDGSFRDANDKALNDTLFTRPSIQRDLFAVCLRFRMYKIAFSADIVKMFRQIWVSEKLRNF